MEKQHPFDRFVARLNRKFILYLAIILAPVYVYSYGAIMALIVDVWPWWASIPTLIAHLGALLGTAALFDRLQALQK